MGKMIRETDAPGIAAEVVGRMMDERLEEARRKRGKPVEEVINETLFHEKRRLERQREREEERQFYQDIATRLPRASAADSEKMLLDVLRRYVDEISGHFDPRIYKVATSILPMGLTGLLNGLTPQRLLRERGSLRSFDDQIELHGAVDATRKLSERGTVVYVPTHSSNLDSIIIGSGLHQAQLPPATYGAGLNLFENRIIGYFMQNLGAYTVDRLKSDPLYREALKEYSTVVLEYERDSLFFPGGTRARSGALENRLKKGLLGTTVKAYANQLRRGRDKRIFIVPVTLNYPLVLEAATLIDDYLQLSGQSRYIIKDDEFSQLDRWVAYARGVFRLDMHIYIRFGDAYDPFGNPVNPDGESLDPNGRVIDPGDYLRVGGEVLRDDARDAEYTRMLSERIVDSYARNNIACATHVVAFALFNALYERSPQRDLYRFLRSLGPQVSISTEDLLPILQRLLDQLGAMADRGEIQLGRVVSSRRAGPVLEHALKRLQVYHTRPVVRREGERMHVNDANLLFFYRNRLEGYRLLGEKELLKKR